MGRIEKEIATDSPLSGNWCSGSGTAGPQRA